MWGLLGVLAAAAIATFTWYNGGSEVVGGLTDAVEGASKHSSASWRFGEAWNDDPWTDDERRAQILRDGDGHQMVRAVGGAARVTMAAKSLAGSPSVPNAPAGLGFSEGQTITEIGVWAHGALTDGGTGDVAAQDQETEPGADPGSAEPGTGQAAGPPGDPAGEDVAAPATGGATDAADLIGCYRFDVEAFTHGLPPGTTVTDTSRTHLASLCIDQWDDAGVRMQADIQVGLEIADGDGVSRGDWVMHLENVEDPYRDGAGWGFTASLVVYHDGVDGMVPKESHLVTGTIRDDVVRVDEPYVLVWGAP